MKVFSVEYQHGGKTFSENISADSQEDASARVEAMFRTGQITELVARIDNPTSERIAALMDRLGM
jgi:hypothetical protein